MVSISGLLAQWAGDDDILQEAAYMAGYCCVVIASAWILRLVCRRPQVLCCIIPFLVIKALCSSCFCGCREVSFGTGPGGQAVSSLVLSADVQVTRIGYSNIFTAVQNKPELKSQHRFQLRF